MKRLFSPDRPGDDGVVDRGVAPVAVQETRRAAGALGRARDTCMKVTRGAGSRPRRAGKPSVPSPRRATKSAKPSPRRATRFAKPSPRHATMSTRRLTKCGSHWFPTTTHLGLCLLFRVSRRCKRGGRGAAGADRAGNPRDGGRGEASCCSCCSCCSCSRRLGDRRRTGRFDSVLAMDCDRAALGYQGARRG